MLAFSLTAKIGVIAMDSAEHTALPVAFDYCGKPPPRDVPAEMPRLYSVDTIGDVPDQTNPGGV